MRPKIGHGPTAPEADAIPVERLGPVKDVRRVSVRSDVYYVVDPFLEN